MSFTAKLRPASAIRKEKTLVFLPAVYTESLLTHSATYCIMKCVLHPHLLHPHSGPEYSRRTKSCKSSKNDLVADDLLWKSRSWSLISGIESIKLCNFSAHLTNFILKVLPCLWYIDILSYFPFLLASRVVTVKERIKYTLHEVLFIASLNTWSWIENWA